MPEDNLFDFYINNSKEKFQGWDFSFITDTNRMVESPLEWSYVSEIYKYISMKDVKTMLDMGTGGGEYLSKFIKLPPKTYATEGYEPNINIAKKRLKLLNVEVKKVENNILDFENDFFDLVINRHESYSEKEVKRVLKTNGIFITQQVGSDNCLEINRALDTKEDMDFGEWRLSIAKNELKNNGFEIIKAMEEFPELRFYDIGALIYYLRAVPWQVKNFSIERYKDKLKEIHNKIQTNNYYIVKEHRFFILAKKR